MFFKTTKLIEDSIWTTLRRDSRLQIVARRQNERWLAICADTVILQVSLQFARDQLTLASCWRLLRAPSSSFSFSHLPWAWRSASSLRCWRRDEQTVLPLDFAQFNRNLFIAYDRSRIACAFIPARASIRLRPKLKMTFEGFPNSRTEKALIHDSHKIQLDRRSTYFDIEQSQHVFWHCNWP